MYNPVQKGHKITPEWANAVEDAIDDIATPLYPNTLKALREAIKGNRVYIGLSVSERGAGANMSVDVSEGDANVNAEYVNKNSTTNVVVTAADSTNPRKDIVVIDENGTISVVAGTPQAAVPTGQTGDNARKPEPPDIPANKVLLAEIWVGASVATITDSNITDRRVLAPQKWPENVQPLTNWAVKYENPEGLVFRWWPKSKFFEQQTATGDANDNEMKCYSMSLFKAFGYGTYQQKAVVIAREADRIFYPFMFESPLGAENVTPPPGATEKGAIIAFTIHSATTYAYTGWDGSNTTTPFTGWDPTTEATLKIEWTATSVKYYVDGALKVTHNDYVPQTPQPYCLELRQDAKGTEYSADGRMFVRDFERIIS